MSPPLCEVRSPNHQDLEDLRYPSDGVLGRLAPQFIPFRLQSLYLRAESTRLDVASIETLILASKDTLKHVFIYFEPETQYYLDRHEAGMDVAILTDCTEATWTALDPVASRLTSLSFHSFHKPSESCKRFLAQRSSLKELSLNNAKALPFVLDALSPEARLIQIALGRRRESQIGEVPYAIETITEAWTRTPPWPQLSTLKRLELIESPPERVSTGISRWYKPKAAWGPQWRREPFEQAGIDANWFLPKSDYLCVSNRNHDCANMNPRAHRLDRDGAWVDIWIDIEDGVRGGSKPGI
ncbi:BZ3500_MvSof-1268-A1-R1_Chr8-2g10231 [Microbotryum saponariae]|uniref:BZ3500_MvSof-1268-A1-R1_Chr8-2g10231 protein n=1 Tax=Microbotryum saponariae TaxID=289078 RepID=A0A2X0KRK8_9BASI|nr:BZ3500_MvSof-1268-A1-R1_Chr8-2g10231 [Microbotryum saponariae]SDA02029.1 BZ3501_MvSof-1269-A2-R1_Chr8-2g09981 [Microbotryum saponariae]